MELSSKTKKKIEADLKKNDHNLNMVGHTLNSSSLEAEAGTGRPLEFEASLVYGLHSEFWDS